MNNLKLFLSTLQILKHAFKVMLIIKQDAIPEEQHPVEY